LHKERVKGVKIKALQTMRNEPAILEFIGGEVYGGMIDICGDGIVSLYECKRLNSSKRGWTRQGSWHMHNGKKIESDTVELNVSSIKNIWVIKSEELDELLIDDVLQFYIDPHHKPFLQGILCECARSSNDRHSLECDFRLHDALSIIYDCGWEGSGYNRESYEKFEEAFKYIRRRLIAYGAKIP
jgi:hypothetical protein